MARPSLLVHWTGRRISTDVDRLSENKRKDYVERLVDILLNGFWMTCPQETLTGHNTKGVSGSVSFKYEAPMTCFTEVRLSQALNHARSYGLLGIAVDRKYVLDRWGSPVHYVRNHSDEKIVGAFLELRHCILTHKTAGTERADELLRYLGTFLKAMSQKNADDYGHLNELEWRIVATEEQVEMGNLRRTGTEQPLYRLLLRRGDVRLVVFPDDRTRQSAYANQRVRAFFSDCQVPFLTIRECEQF
jgi:hypothetical protein